MTSTTREGHTHDGPLDYSHSETIMRILHYNAKKNSIQCTADKLFAAAREIDDCLLQAAPTADSYLDKHTLKRRIMALFRRQRHSVEELDAAIRLEKENESVAQDPARDMDLNS